MRPCDCDKKRYENCDCPPTQQEGEELDLGETLDRCGYPAQQQEGQESKPEQELKADTKLGKKLLSVWMDHCSEDASSGDETLMADLDDGQLLFEAVIALNQQEGEELETANESFERAAARFRKDTGMMAPGKDDVSISHTHEERLDAWDKWSKEQQEGHESVWKVTRKGRQHISVRNENSMIQFPYLCSRRKEALANAESVCEFLNQSHKPGGVMISRELLKICIRCVGTVELHASEYTKPLAELKSAIDNSD